MEKSTVEEGTVEKELDVNRDSWRQCSVAKAATALLLVAGLAAPAIAQAAAAEAAQVTVYAGGVDFLPNDAYSKAVLVVSGHGTSHRYEFDSYQKVTIGLFDAAGELLPDGRYGWELTLVPTEAEARQLRTEAEENGGVTPQAYQPQAGTFAIRDGAIADPALREARPRTRATDRGGVPLELSAPSGLAASRPAALDQDAAAGSREGTEAAISAAARRQTPVATAVAAPADDTDAAAATFGRSQDASTTRNDNPTAQPTAEPAPRPRSDGSHGRPRSNV